MSEKAKAVLEELAREADGNREAQAFLAGLKAGFQYGGKAQADEKGADPDGGKGE